MAERRYEPILKLAAGGMATVFVGTARGGMGFRQLVALKKPHPHLLEDPSYRRELVAEARSASLIHHANVVDVRDVEVEGDAITLVMDYIEGASLAELLNEGLRGGARVPPAVAVRVILDACAGLHAAHELVDEKGRALGLVHRDVSPQNLLVGLDGTTRVADFGVAKLSSAQSTAHGTLKGKLAYMAPEYLRNERIDRRLDVFALGVVLWESLTYERLFRGDHDAETLRKVLELRAPLVSERAPGLGTALDSVIATALSKDPAERFQTTLAFGNALEATARAHGLVASHPEVAAIVASLAGATLEARRALVRKKLAEEPSLLSFMNGEAPAAVAALGATAAPATKPTMDTLPLDPAPAPANPPVATLPLAKREPSATSTPAPAAVTAPATFEEPSRPFDPMSISQLPPTPKRSLALPIGIALVAVVALGAGATWVATHRDDATGGEDDPSPSAERAAPTASAGPDASALGAPSLAPLTTKTAPRASTPHAGSAHAGHAASPSAKPPNESDPPPNPY
jgi:serine/threonine-protein kinase